MVSSFVFIGLCLGLSQKDRVRPEKYEVQSVWQNAGPEAETCATIRIFFEGFLLLFFSDSLDVRGSTMLCLFSLLLFVCFGANVMQFKRMCNWSSMGFFHDPARFRLFLSDRKMWNLVLSTHQRTSLSCARCFVSLLWAFFFSFFVSVSLCCVQIVFSSRMCGMFPPSRGRCATEARFFLSSWCSRFHLFLSDRKMWNLVMSWF